MCPSPRAQHWESSKRNRGGGGDSVPPGPRWLGCGKMLWAPRLADAERFVVGVHGWWAPWAGGGAGWMTGRAYCQV